MQTHQQFVQRFYFWMMFCPCPSQAGHAIHLQLLFQHFQSSLCFFCLRICLILLLLKRGLPILIFFNLIFRNESFWKRCQLRMVHRTTDRAFLTFLQVFCQNSRPTVFQNSFCFHTLFPDSFILFSDFQKYLLFFSELSFPRSSVPYPLFQNHANILCQLCQLISLVSDLLHLCRPVFQLCHSFLQILYGFFQLFFRCIITCFFFCKYLLIVCQCGNFFF